MGGFVRKGQFILPVSEDITFADKQASQAGEETYTYNYTIVIRWILIS